MRVAVVQLRGLGGDQVRLNIGSGANFLKGYINIDREPMEVLAKRAQQAGRDWERPAHGTAFLQHDVMEGLPFPDSVVVEIYANQFLEHLTSLELVDFLTDCYRILASGAMLHGTVPNIDYIIEAYEGKATKFWDPIVALGPYQPWENLLANFCHAWGHRAVFNDLMLAKRLANAGFEARIWRSVDDPWNIHFEAVKPDAQR